MRQHTCPACGATFEERVTMAYELEQFELVLSNDKRCAYFKFPVTPVYCSVKLIAPPWTIAYENPDHTLASAYPLPEKKAGGVPRLDPDGENRIDYQTLELFASFDRPVDQVFVECMYICSE